MATKAEVQVIADDASCVVACVSEKQLLAMAVYLLFNQVNPGVPMTKAEIQTLTDESSCIAQCMSHKMLLAAMVQLLFEGGGGGAGSKQLYSGGAAPPAAPDNPAEANLWYSNDTTQPFQTWNGASWDVR